jgi:RNA-directed DNA polymerase
VNTDAPWPDLYQAERRVLGIQTKLHRWAIDDPGRCFDDLFNLVCEPASMVDGKGRVRREDVSRASRVSIPGARQKSTLGGPPSARR